MALHVPGVTAGFQLLDRLFEPPVVTVQLVQKRLGSVESIE